MVVVPFIATQVIAGANSITKIGGDSGLEIGEGEIPDVADVKLYDSNHDIWDDEW